MSIRLEDLYQSVPAMFATSPMQGVSKNYSFIPTHEIVQEFLDRGWEIRTAKQKTARNPDRQATKKHYIILQNPSMKVNVNGEELAPEAILINAHDRTAAYRIKLGIIRFLCWNGLVASKASFADYRFTHSNIKESALDNFHEYFAAKVPDIIESVRSWADVMLNRDDADHFIEEALTLRFPIARTVNFQDISFVRRQEDNSSSLWHIYNRVQENLTLGGFRATNPDNNKTRTVRAIKDPDRNMRFNEDLWDLASRYYQELTNNGTTKTKGTV